MTAVIESSASLASSSSLRTGNSSGSSSGFEGPAESPAYALSMSVFPDEEEDGLLFADDALETPRRQITVIDDEELLDLEFTSEVDWLSVL